MTEWEVLLFVCIAGMGLLATIAFLFGKIGDLWLAVADLQNGYNQPPQNSYNQPPQGNNYGQPCQQGQLSQVSPYQPQGNGYPQQGAAPHGDSTDWWGQFGHAVPQGSGNGKDEDIPF